MSDHPREFEIPERLADDLTSLQGFPGLVPARIDDAIMNRARARFAGQRMRIVRWAGVAAAVAACILVVRMNVHPIAANPDDLDGNRRVDIVDALKLAHQINTGKGRDINGDGVIDQRDVDAIAMAAVRLDPVGGVQ